MKTFLLKSSLWLPTPRAELFPFFADPGNLQRLTPPWLHFKILKSSTPEIRQGTVIDYRLRVHGLPLRWRSEISAWEPPFRFVDEQRRGPYRRWIHQHLFTERDGGTQVDDLVEYAVLGGALVNRLLVRRDLDSIFAYRCRMLQEIFAPGPEGLGAHLD
ncbi:MAG: SRPBCC family protein [Deltaproteobacteria bacterium]|nr:SRPBCC family protein [Deltaproteobacteria bacterium]